MHFSTLLQRDDIGPGPYPDVTKIPTPPLQAAALAIIFTLPSIAIVVFSLRIYTRVTMRMLGIGMAVPSPAIPKLRSDH